MMGHEEQKIRVRITTNKTKNTNQIKHLWLKVQCDGENLIRVSRVVRANAGVDGGAVSMKVYGSDGSSVLEIGRDGIRFGELDVCLIAEEDGDGRRNLIYQIDHRRRIGFFSALMTSGSFTMVQAGSF